MKPSAFQYDRIKTVLSTQYPTLDVDKILGNVDISVSRKTRRIREIFDVADEKILLFTLKTSDGRYLASYEAGRRMLESGYWDRIVEMNDESVEFIKRGKSAFCKHVIAVHGTVQPLQEVLLVDQHRNLLAIGSAVQPGYAMMQLESGVAVKTRAIQKLG